MLSNLAKSGFVIGFCSALIASGMVNLAMFIGGPYWIVILFWELFWFWYFTDLYFKGK